MNLSEMLNKIAADYEPTEPATPRIIPPTCIWCGQYESKYTVLDDKGLCADCKNTINRGYEISYKQGRCLNGAHRDAGPLNHARWLVNGEVDWKAVCGTEPGRLSGGWSEWDIDRQVTCKKCLKRLEAISENS